MVTMNAYRILYGGTNKTDLRDTIIAVSKVEAIKQFIIENKGQVLVYGVSYVR